MSAGLAKSSVGEGGLEVRKYRIVVCCGANIATSTIAVTKLAAMLPKQGIQADLIKCSIRELPSYQNVDLIVSTTLVPGARVPVVNGLPLVTGVGAEKVVEEIVQKLLGKESSSRG